MYTTGHSTTTQQSRGHRPYARPCPATGNCKVCCVGLYTTGTTGSRGRSPPIYDNVEMLSGTNHCAAAAGTAVGHEQARCLCRVGTFGFNPSNNTPAACEHSISIIQNTHTNPCLLHAPSGPPSPPSADVICAGPDTFNSSQQDAR